MKICIFSDVHWTTYSSIVRRRGLVYSVELEHLIDSMNFVNKVATDTKCDAMICAGDFFNKPQATDEELTALKEIKWNDLPCYFLCGNHESSVSDLRFSSLKALESEHHFIIDKPLVWKYNNDENEIRFLPYTVESDRKPLTGYFNKGLGKTIIISHNDIAGIMYGGFESKSGFSIEEIEENCDLYLNGHLHNSEFITKKILNVGSFSAHNFTNDSERYSYGIWILDTDDSTIEFIDNPYGFNYYKFDISSKSDLKKLDSIKNNAVLSIKCSEKLLEECNKKLSENKDKIEEQRIMILRDIKSVSTESIQDLQGADHIQRLIKFCHDNISDMAALDEELAEICK